MAYVMQYMQHHLCVAKVKGQLLLKAKSPAAQETLWFWHRELVAAVWVGADKVPACAGAVVAVPGQQDDHTYGQPSWAPDNQLLLVCGYHCIDGFVQQVVQACQGVRAGVLCTHCIVTASTHFECCQAPALACTARLHEDAHAAMSGHAVVRHHLQFSTFN